MKPFSESCEQNKQVILDVIQPLLSACHCLLEIGSGTGQHAVYFSQKMPHLQWQTSDRQSLLPGIQLWLDEYRQSSGNNIQPAIALDVSRQPWPQLSVDAIFSANTLHIMSDSEVVLFFKNIPAVLADNGLVMVYGPFNYQAEYTSDSNRQFDGWLKQRDPKSGIKDFETVNKLAGENGLKILVDYDMPANNRILLWQKETNQSGTGINNKQ